MDVLYCMPLLLIIYKASHCRVDFWEMDAWQFVQALRPHMSLGQVPGKTDIESLQTIGHLAFSLCLIYCVLYL